MHWHEFVHYSALLLSKCSLSHFLHIFLPAIFISGLIFPKIAVTYKSYQKVFLYEHCICFPTADNILLGLKVEILCNTILLT